MKDYIHNLKRTDFESEFEQLMKRAFIVFFVFIFIALMYTSISLANTQKPVTCANTQMVDRGDLIISDDMDDYLHKQGHNQAYLLEDLE